MIREITVAALLTLASAFAMAQMPQTAATSPAVATPSPDADLTIHYKGPGVVAPELLPPIRPFNAPDKCKKLDGTVTLFLAVDGKGKPVQIYLLSALGNALDNLAVSTLEFTADFKPGTVDGAPATVAVMDEMKIQACAVDFTDATGRTVSEKIVQRSFPEQRIQLAKRPAPLRSPPPPQQPAKSKDPLPPGVYRVGGDVFPPKLLKNATADFVGELVSRHHHATCDFNIVVNEHGFSRDPAVTNGPSYCFDPRLVQSLLNDRFTPGMRNGDPVPVQIKIEIAF
jgi:hypothetical protein